MYLLKLYLEPPNPAKLGVLSMFNKIDRSAEPNIQAALTLLQLHPTEIDTVKVWRHRFSPFFCSYILFVIGSETSTRLHSHCGSVQVPWKCCWKSHSSKTRASSSKKFTLRRKPSGNSATSRKKTWISVTSQVIAILSADERTANVLSEDKDKHNWRQRLSILSQEDWKQCLRSIPKRKSFTFRMPRLRFQQILAHCIRYELYL